jgi:hypothetical protein
MLTAQQRQAHIADLQAFFTEHQLRVQNTLNASYHLWWLKGEEYDQLSLRRAILREGDIERRA